MQPPPLLAAQKLQNARKSLAQKRGGSSSRNELTAKSCRLNFVALLRGAFGSGHTKWIKHWKRAGTPAIPIQILLKQAALSSAVKIGLQSPCQFVWIICYIFSTRQKLRRSSYANDGDDLRLSVKSSLYLKPVVNTIPACNADKTFGLLPQG